MTDRELDIEVSTLDIPHKRAFEDVIGCELADDQRLVIRVEPMGAAASGGKQTLEDWSTVYDGLSDDEVAAVDKIANTRADLTRDIPVVET